MSKHPTIDRLKAITASGGETTSCIPGRPPIDAASIRRRFEQAAAATLYGMGAASMPEARALIGVSRYEFEAVILPRCGVATTDGSDEAQASGMPVRE